MPTFIAQMWDLGLAVILNKLIMPLDVVFKIPYKRGARLILSCYSNDVYNSPVRSNCCVAPLLQVLEIIKALVKS